MTKANQPQRKKHTNAKGGKAPRAVKSVAKASPIPTPEEPVATIIAKIRSSGGKKLSKNLSQLAAEQNLEDGAKTHRKHRPGSKARLVARHQFREPHKKLVRDAEIVRCIHTVLGKRVRIAGAAKEFLRQFLESVVPSELEGLVEFCRVAKVKSPNAAHIIRYERCRRQTRCPGLFVAPDQ